MDDRICDIVHEGKDEDDTHIDVKSHVIPEILVDSKVKT